MGGESEREREIEGTWCKTDMKCNQHTYTHISERNMHSVVHLRILRNGKWLKGGGGEIAWVHKLTLYLVCMYTASVYVYGYCPLQK